MQWLKHETLESALERILARLRKNQRESLLAQVQAATIGYTNERCCSYDFFAENYAIKLNNSYNLSKEDSEDECDLNDCSDTDESDEFDEFETSGKKESKQDSGTEIKDNEIDDDTEEEICEETDISSEDDEQDHPDDNTKHFSNWFLKKLYNAELPRFFVDLIHLKKYINSPQIEHFAYNDCNRIAIPILIHTFTLLNSVEQDGETVENTSIDDEHPIEFTYLTRVTKLTNIRYDRYSKDKATNYSFNPNLPNPLLFKKVFENNFRNIDNEGLFEKVNMLPKDLQIFRKHVYFFKKSFVVNITKDLQMYFLSIVYWLQKSSHCDQIHLRSLLVCLIVLRTIDSKIPAERDLTQFNKLYGKIIKKERSVRQKEELEGSKRCVKVELLSLSIPDRMQFIPKSDCYLVMDNLLKHFHTQEIFKKKYDDYSSMVLHAFAEFQSILFQLYSLNALLDFPFQRPRLEDSYCGVFLYNLYDLLKSRTDVHYYIKTYVFHDSQLMFDFYIYLSEWCDKYVRFEKHTNVQPNTKLINKEVIKKKKTKKTKQKTEEEKQNSVLDNDVKDKSSEEEAEFNDLNNRFCSLLKVR